jgi:hypothetical protein
MAPRAIQLRQILTVHQLHDECIGARRFLKTVDNRDVQVVLARAATFVQKATAEKRGK